MAQALRNVGLAGLLTLASGCSTYEVRSSPIPAAVGSSPGVSAEAPGDPGAVGYLYQPAFSVDYELRRPAHPYVPQPGDIFLATDERWFARSAHLVAHSGAPHHSGIVFALPDGRPALLEAGPDNSWFIRVLDLPTQLEFYHNRKRVWIRQRAVPLTPEQSHRLTVFAMNAADRPFAEARMVLQGYATTKSKGVIRTRLLGRPHAANFDPDNPDAGMRKKYFCSELVTEACVASCLLPPDTTRPVSMYPRELFFGSSRIPYIRKYLDMSAWLPPARWTASPGAEPDLERHPFIDGDAGSIRRSP